MMMAKTSYLIGIDLGTSATKTVLFDAQGHTIASASAAYPMMQPHNGWAEQDPADWVQAAITTLRRVLTESGVNPSDVAGIGISGQMHGLVMLDEADQVLRPCILWCDQRTGAQCEKLTQMVGAETLVRITANPALTGFTASKILWVKENEPDIFRRCRKIMLPKDYLRYVMTGAFAGEMSDASGMQLLDVPKRCWSGEMLQALGLTEAMLPRLYESPEVTGFVSEEMARLTGLAAGTPVVGGAGDNAAAAVGTGVVAEGQAFTTIGTSGVVYAHTKEPMIDPLGRVHTFCCAVPGQWHVMGVTQGAGLSLQWFRNEFCADEMREAQESGREVYDIMSQKAAAVPPGADRLLYLPYLMGERTPHLNPDCRGVFFGLSASHTRGHLIRAVMEGVSHSLWDCLEVLAEMQVQPEKMLLCGGGARSPLWSQMLCDMFGIPVQTAASEGPALGVAVLAAVGAGIYNTVPEACQHMVSPEGTGFKPQVENAAYYQNAHKLYGTLYKQLKESFAVLAKL